MVAVLPLPVVMVPDVVVPPWPSQLRAADLSAHDE
jgi:hypothetical protein